MKYFYYLVFILVAHQLQAQDVFMENGTFTRCAPDRFYDSGGPNGPYSSNENIVTTICAPNAEEFIILQFTAFSTQLNVDEMTIYDGDDTSAPVIGVYNGANTPGTVIASDTNTSGCITIQFITNDSGTTTGFAADIICAVPCQELVPFVESTVPEASSSGVVQITSGEEVQFVGNANFENDGTDAIYEWSFGDGDDATGNEVSHVFNGEGEYTVTLTVTDNNPLGCEASTTISVFVLGANIVVDTDAFTVEQLVTNVLINSACADITNITSSTGTSVGDVNGIGYFANDGSQFPFLDGILLSSGNASKCRRPE